jgi:hypothetical protein
MPAKNFIGYVRDDMPHLDFQKQALDDWCRVRGHNYLGTIEGREDYKTEDFESALSEAESKNADLLVIYLDIVPITSYRQARKKGKVSICEVYMP